MRHNVSNVWPRDTKRLDTTNSAASYQAALHSTYLIKTSLILFPLIFVFQSQCWILCLQEDTKVIQINQWNVVLCDNIFNTVTKNTSSGSKTTFEKSLWQVCSKYYYKYLQDDFCLTILLHKNTLSFKEMWNLIFWTGRKSNHGLMWECSMKRLQCLFNSMKM